jgi:cell division protein FtsN
VGSEDFASLPTIAEIESPSAAWGEARSEDLPIAEFARAEASSAEEPSSAESSTTVADHQEATESAEPPHEADALQAAAMPTTDTMDEPPAFPTAAANTEEQATTAHAPRAIAPSPAPVAAPGRRFFVQVGAYRDEKLATRVCERVAALGFDAAVVTRPSRSWYFCRSQQPRGVGEAKALIQQIEALKIGAPLLVPARQSG